MKIIVKTTRNSIVIVSIVLLCNQAFGMQQRVVQSAKRPATTQLRHVGTVAAQQRPLATQPYVLQPYQKQGKVSLTNPTCPKSTFDQKRQYSSFFVEWFKPKADKNVEKAQVEAIEGEIIEKPKPEYIQEYEQRNKLLYHILLLRKIGLRDLDKIPAENIDTIVPMYDEHKDSYVSRDDTFLKALIVSTSNNRYSTIEQKKLIEALLNKGAKPNMPGFTADPLATAIRYHNIGALEALVDSGRVETLSDVVNKVSMINPENIQMIKNQANDVKNLIVQYEGLYANCCIINRTMPSVGSKYSDQETLDYIKKSLNDSKGTLLVLQKMIQLLENSPVYHFQEYLRTIKDKNVSHQEIQRKFDSLFKNK